MRAGTMAVRRTVLQAFLAVAGASLTTRFAPARSAAASGLSRQLAELERQSGGRLGVCCIATGTGERFEHRADERFPMCSTFKVLAAAAVLGRVDRGEEKLERRIAYGHAELLEYAPVTRARVGEGGLTVEELCDAAVRVSDNTAANLLLATLGGPPAVTRYARALGDVHTRLDRTEPTLNRAEPGDVRDTTTPRAMASDLRALLLGSALSAQSRDKLLGWMRASTTGRERLRAGVPAGWRVADKTGSGENGTTNDVAVLWPPHGAPLIVAGYLTGLTAPLERRNAVFAQVARRIVTETQRVR